ncbi:hypothetical protein [Chitinophaga oryziterrae]|nr:hypothetical protein [Chitinophaga oryziterrae]
MKTSLLFKLACLLIASMVLVAHLLHKSYQKLRTAKVSNSN